MTSHCASKPATPARYAPARAFALAGAVVAGVTAWSTLIEPQLFTIRRHTLPVLPRGNTPVRVLQLSDLHLAPFHHRKISWVRSLAQLRPDLVVLTGDLMGHRNARGPLRHALQPFADAGIPGVFVHGSNDYYAPLVKNPLKYLREPSRKSTRTPDLNNAGLTADLENLGLYNLNNSAQRLTVRGTPLEFFGLNDPHIQYDQPHLMRETLNELRNGETFDRRSPATKPANAHTRIGVVHAPYQAALSTLLDCGAQLLIAGHTHGGQVRLPGVGALTANCDLPTAQARGLSVWYHAHDAAYLNVSAGLGASIYAPIRFACRPEASLLTLEAAR